MPHRLFSVGEGQLKRLMSALLLCASTAGCAIDEYAFGGAFSEGAEHYQNDTEGCANWPL